MSYSYTSLAIRYEVDLCTSEDHCGELSRTAHRRGVVGWGDIHWHERRYTKSGLRRFLILVGQVRLLRGDRTEAEWIHDLNMFAYRTALHDLGVQLPRHLAAQDRARVRFLLRGENRKSQRRLVEWSAA